MTDDSRQSNGERESSTSPIHRREDEAPVNSPKGEPHLFDWLLVIVRRRYVVVTALIVSTALAAVHAFTATPMYEGRVQLLIDADDPNIVNFAQVVDESQARQDYYQTQYRLIRSRSVAKKTIESLDLWKSRELVPDPSQARFSLTSMMRGAGEWVVSKIRPVPASTDEEDVDSQAPEARVVNILLNRLVVTPVRGSRLVEIRYRAEDPKLAARVADAVAAAFIEQNLSFRSTTTHDASSWLREQLSEQRKAVALAEVRLQRFREQNETMPFNEGENIVVQKLTELNAAVTRARIERMQKEAMYEQLKALQENPEALETFPEILSNGFIQEQKVALAQLQRESAELTRRYGERHPSMIRMRSAIEAVHDRIEGGIGEVVQAVGIEYQTARAQEQSLEDALAGQRSAALAMNRKAIDYGVLERDVLSNKQIYEALLRRTQEIGISGELRTSNVRVVDSAEVPTRPVTPRLPLTLSFGFFGGLVFGVGLAFLFDYVDSRITTPEEIESYLGLPSLGLIPLADGSATNRNPLIGQGAPVKFIEAFRTLRTNILFSTTKEGCLSIVVTSTGLGDGKTLVASNLAIGMAQVGKRVLLVDTDMRRPRSHAVFSLAAEPGLSNVLVGAATFDEAVRQVADVPNLWLLPAGRTPPNPAELLASERFADLISPQHQRFDMVIFDSSPVMAVTDPAIVAHRATGVLFVVAADRTSRYAAKRALHQLGHARVRFVGAVLNRVDLDRNAYYYSRYYREEYSVYYGAASH